MKQGSNWLNNSPFVKFWRPRPPDLDQGLMYDLDGSLHFTRFPSGSAKYSWRPRTIKPLSGFMPMQDAIVLQMAIAKPPSGPGVETPISLPTKTIYAQLPKQMG